MCIPSRIPPFPRGRGVSSAYHEVRPRKGLSGWVPSLSCSPTDRKSVANSGNFRGNSRMGAVSGFGPRDPRRGWPLSTYEPGTARPRTETEEPPVPRMLDVSDDVRAEIGDEEADRLLAGDN